MIYCNGFFEPYSSGISVQCYYNINWIATDTSVNSTSSYIVYANSSIHDPGSPWTSNNPVIINLDGFAEGHHNITIVFYDGYGNVNSSEILLIVDESSTGGGTTDDDDDSSPDEVGNIPGGDLILLYIISIATLIYIALKSRKKRLRL